MRLLLILLLLLLLHESGTNAARADHAFALAQSVHSRAAMKGAIAKIHMDRVKIIIYKETKIYVY